MNPPVPVRMLRLCLLCVTLGAGGAAHGGAIRYNVLHLDAVYGEDLFFMGMSKGGIISASNATSFIRIQNGVATAYPLPVAGGYLPFNDAGFAYVLPDVEPIQLHTFNTAGELHNTGYVPEGNSLGPHGQNRLGTVVGYEAPVFNPQEGVAMNAGFAYSPTTGGQRYFTLGGVPVSNIHVVNDQGWMAGYGAGTMYLWIPGQPAIRLFDSFYSEIADMNNAGQMVGILGNTGFYWSGGNLLALGQIRVEDPAHPGVFNTASGRTSGLTIAENGIVGGYSYVQAVPGYLPSQLGRTAWLWSPQNGLELMDGMIDPALGIRVGSVFTIADDGSIFASGLVPGYSGTQYLLLTPVPEPNTALLATLAIGGILLRRRRERSFSVTSPAPVRP